MKKLLRPRDILLLGLTNALDAFEELKDPLHLVSKSYDQMYGWVPDQYKKHHFNHLVWRSLRAGYIEKIEKDGEIYIRITSSGAKRIQRDFPLLSLQNKTWDHKWRIVMFDIAEIQKKKRDYLREKLKELGFGMLQESVFITPHDILRDFLEYAESIGLRDSVDILEASYILGEKKQLANRVWRLEDLSKKYLEIQTSNFLSRVQFTCLPYAIYAYNGCPAGSILPFAGIIPPRAIPIITSGSFILLMIYLPPAAVFWIRQKS